jgi:hypothetical protein
MQSFALTSVQGCPAIATGGMANARAIAGPRPVEIAPPAIKSTSRTLFQASEFD